MKKVILSLLTLTTTMLNATPSAGLMCRSDNRLENGSLHEFILAPNENGYSLQTQYVPSLDSPSIEIDTWAQKLSCLIDEKARLAFCQNEDGVQAQVTERREFFYDSLEESKKKSTKYIDISLSEGGEVSKKISFAANHCESFGGQA
ncbi:MAG: hypothetical protein KC505_05390 [Myxococcales bacterium]|nr:hypothetical protein [Myxococcales bacterium]USN51498.1 MAG: hypothetical protein H6731_03585 [Myxococcales bacterium]